MFANNVVIIDHDHIMTPSGVSGDLTAAPVIIDDRVWVWANAVILKGVHIGEGAVIAAGAVVTKDIPAGAVAMGIPAVVCL